MTVIGPEEKQAARPSQLEEIRERHSCHHGIRVDMREDIGWLLEEVDRLRADNDALYGIIREHEISAKYYESAMPYEEYTRLRIALFKAYDDICFSAYHQGHCHPDGTWDNCALSDARWLQNAITGSASRGDKTQALDITRAIPRLAEAMVKAIENGGDALSARLDTPNAE